MDNTTRVENALACVWGSCQVLLRQWGFVLPSLASPPDAAIVDISHLITLDGAVRHTRTLHLRTSSSEYFNHE